MKKNKTNPEKSPTTKRTMSTPKFILTLFLTLVITLSLVVGGTLGYFSMQNQNFYTVDGKEILTPAIIQAVQSQLRTEGISSSQKYNMLMQFLQQEAGNQQWAAFAKKQDIAVTAVDLINVLKPNYEELKKSQQANNTPFNQTYSQFLKDNVDIFNARIAQSNINIPINPSYYDVAVEYAAQKTFIKAKYFYITLENYMKDKYFNELNTFYKNWDNKPIYAKKLKVLEYPNLNQADAAAEDFNKNPDKIKETFTDILPTITLTVEDSEAYIFVRNTPINQVSTGFFYNNTYYVGQVIEELYTPYNQLNTKAMQELTQNYFNTLHTKEKNNVIKQIKILLEEAYKGSTNPLVTEGQTAPISLNDIGNIKDSYTQQILPFINADNTSYYETLLQNNPIKNDVNKHIKEYSHIYYIMEPIGKTLPVYPIPKADYESIVQNIKDKEQRLWFFDYYQKIQSSIPVYVNNQNIQSLIGGE